MLLGIIANRHAIWLGLLLQFTQDCDDMMLTIGESHSRSRADIHNALLTQKIRVKDFEKAPDFNISDQLNTVQING